MGWISRDFKCTDCGLVEALVLDRQDDTDDYDYECSECSGISVKILSAPRVMNHSHPDGSGRFDRIRETTRLRRARSDARAAGDKTTERKLDAEIKKV